MADKVKFRSRKWFITINQGAKCYNCLQDIINYQKGLISYYYILHDRDNDEQPHYHVVLDYANARVFSTLLNTFEGAHIENCMSLNMSVQYLIHQGIDNKFSYSPDDIVHNVTPEKLFNLLTSHEYDLLDTESLLNALSSGEVSSLYACVNKYGISQCTGKIGVISGLLKEYRAIENLQDKYDFLLKDYNDLLEKYNNLQDNFINMEDEENE